LQFTALKTGGADYVHWQKNRRGPSLKNRQAEAWRLIEETQPWLEDDLSTKLNDTRRPGIGNHTEGLRPGAGNVG
jgi:hypothetical protein